MTKESPDRRQGGDIHPLMDTQARPEDQPAPPEQAGLRTILQALQTHAYATSLRSAAREVGMTPSGLQKVFDGSTPYRATQDKLWQWYGRYLAGQHDTARDVALRTLLTQVPRSRRDRAHQLISAILRGEDPCAGG